MPPLEIPFTNGEPVHFLDAIRAAEARGVVLPDVYYGQLQGVARQQAFSIAGIAAYDQLRAVMDSLKAATATGQTFAQWQQEQAVKGLELPKYRLENLYRTNLQNHYQAGHWEKFERNKASRPYLMYDAINDSRTRPAHRAMDGIIRPVDDPFWHTHSPPCGHNCRCTLISLTEAQANARSGNGNGLDKPVDGQKMQPDNGFGYSPLDRLKGVEQALVKRQEQGGGVFMPSRVLLSALNQLMAQDMKIISLDGFERVQEKMADVAKKHPEWFPLGFAGIHAVSNPELFAGFDPGKGEFYVSAVDELLPGFNPAKELSDALAKIGQGEALTFNNEYAMETVWHEMVHGMTGVSATRTAIGKEPFEEGIVQLAARHSYPMLVDTFGGSAAHHHEIISNGFAYRKVTANLFRLFRLSGVDAEALLDRLNHVNWKNDLIVALANGSQLPASKIRYLLSKAEELNDADFQAKIAVQIRNARNNKGAP